MTPTTGHEQPTERASQDLDVTPTRAESRTRSYERVRDALSPQRIGAIYIWIAVAVIFAIWVPDLFLRMSTVYSIVNQYSVTALISLSLVCALASGTFDLSIGSVVSLSGTLSAWLLAHTGLPIGLVIAAAVLAGLLVGLVNGLVIVVWGIDSFIGTLATGSIVVALALGLSSGGQLQTEGVDRLSFLAGSVVGDVGLPIVYVLVVMIVIGFFLEQTPTGRRVYAVGANREAARLAGVDVRWIPAITLLISGALSAFAGVVLTARIGAADPAAGASYLIPAFAAAFLGATQFRNGRFNTWGTVVAVMLLGTASVGLLLTSAPNWTPDVFSGVILIAAVGISIRQRRLGRG
jgi:ribose transport system permease protein